MRPCDGLLTKCSCHGDHRCPSQALWGHGQPCVVIYQSRSGLPPCGSGTAPGQKKTACWSQFSILFCQSPFFEAGPVARLQKPGFDTIGLKIEGRRPKSSVFARWSRLKIGYSLSCGTSLAKYSVAVFQGGGIVPPHPRRDAGMAGMLGGPWPCRPVNMVQGHPRCTRQPLWPPG